MQSNYWQVTRATVVRACLEAACSDQQFQAHLWQHEMPWRLQWCGQLQCAHRSL